MLFEVVHDENRWVVNGKIRLLQNLLTFGDHYDQLGDFSQELELRFASLIEGVTVQVHDCKKLWKVWNFITLESVNQLRACEGNVDHANRLVSGLHPVREGNFAEHSIGVRE